MGESFVIAKAGRPMVKVAALDNGYTEPPLHKDPFDRLLLAQALTEGITLLTGDALPARYPGPVRKV